MCASVKNKQTVMKERIKELTDLLERLRSESYGDQYGIADFIETDPKLQKDMDELAAESDMYTKMQNSVALYNEYINQLNKNMLPQCED